MNKILRKCREFGIIVRLTDISTKEVLKCVRSLKNGNIPLCLVDSDKSGWELLLREIAFKEDLFIAAENINSIEDAYLAAGNGAQFFILSDSNITLMKQLKQNGFFFIPRVSNEEDIKNCEQLELECILPKTKSLGERTKLYNIEEASDCYNIEHNIKTLFTIIDLDTQVEDYQDWINKVVKNYLGLNFTQVTINNRSPVETVQFGEIFAAVNKCKICNEDENTVLLECRHFTKTISYLKWKNLFINPNDVEIVEDEIVKGHLDLKIGDFKIIIKERK